MLDPPLCGFFIVEKKFYENNFFAAALMLFNVLVGGYLTKLALSPLVYLSWPEANILFSVIILMNINTRGQKFDFFRMSFNRFLFVVGVGVATLLSYPFL